MSYNESLNNNNKKSKMDLQFWYQGKEKDMEVKVRFWSTIFFGLATVRDLKNLLEAAAQPGSLKLI